MSRVALAAAIAALLAACSGDGGRTDGGGADGGADGTPGQGCEAMPQGNVQCTLPGLPNYYLCRIPFTPPPTCVSVLVGDTIEGYCCP